MGRVFGRVLGALLMASGAVAATAPPAAADPLKFTLVNTMTWDCLDGTTFHVQATPCDQRYAQIWYLQGWSSTALQLVNSASSGERCMYAPIEAHGALVETAPCVLPTSRQWTLVGAGGPGDFEIRPNGSTSLCVSQADTIVFLETCSGWRRQRWTTRDF
ncbi:hypothetical protein EDD29_5339 [Actinocorallia herbida]|uniref:Uncharacterized protein n=1 Tax=Actinocorallia herbida TaxID=58109 RepID=A0A3N1D2J2_9ACTN|nr:hypothetical protein [Actinocorallia herbida]ROO87710.1 hypothetical protein EDD29_5339 [Actinocorallia herbida]